MMATERVSLGAPNLSVDGHRGRRRERGGCMQPMSQRDKAEAFRTLHHGSRLLVLPNAWDVMGARLIESAGFSAIATSSAGVAWALGYPDGERISRGEMLAVVGRNIEDGTDEGRLVDIALHQDRIRAIREAGAATGVPLVINARTDAFEVAGWSPAERLTTAARRANAYRA